MNVVLGNRIRIVAKGNLGVSPEWRLIFDYTVDAEGTGVITSAILEEWYNALAAVLDPCMHISSELYQVVATNETQWQQESFAPAVPSAGDWEGHMMPAQVSALVTAYTGMKRCIGKKYLPAIGENAWGGGAWEAAMEAALQDFAEWWGSHVVFSNGVDLMPAIYSQVDAGNYPISSFVVRPYPSTQRRRKPGRGI